MRWKKSSRAAITRNIQRPGPRKWEKTCLFNKNDIDGAQRTPRKHPPRILRQEKRIRTAQRKTETKNWCRGVGGGGDETGVVSGLGWCGDAAASTKISRVCVRISRKSGRRSPRRRRRDARAGAAGPSTRSGATPSVTWSSCRARKRSCRWAACPWSASRSASCPPAARRRVARSLASWRCAATAAAAAACRSASAGSGTGCGSTPPGRTATFPADFRCDRRPTTRTHLKQHAKFSVRNLSKIANYICTKISFSDRTLIMNLSNVPT